jgi:HSP20 family protein
MKIVKWRNEPSVFDLMNSFFENDLNISNRSGNYSPATNVIENENGFELELASPGLSKEDFKINVENQVLTISSEKEVNSEQKEKNYTRKEFMISSFSRSFTLPKSVDIDRIKAEYKDGVLKVELPKREEENTKIQKQISIN